MRYSVLGFNQAKVMELSNTMNTKIDIEDLMLLTYIQTAAGSTTMLKHLEDNKVFVWLSHSKILEDLPILNIKEDMLKKRLAKLVELGLVETKKLANEKLRGSRSYYCITELCETLLYENEEDTTKCKKLHLENGPSVKNYTCSERPSVKNYTSSNNQLINTDNIVKKDNKDVYTQRFIFLYNAYGTNLPSIKKLTDKRTKAIVKLYSNYSEDDIKQVFINISKSDFLQGKCGGFRADLDWICNENNFIKILEGRYNTNYSKSNKPSSDMDGRVSKVATSQQKNKFREDILNGRAEKF